RLHHYPCGLRFCSLREMHVEHTVLRGGRDLFRLHGSTAQKAPAERPGRPLAVVIPAMPMLGVRKGALACKRQHVVLDSNGQIVSFHPGEIRHEHACVLVLQQVYRGVYMDSRMPDGGVLPAKDSKSRSISCLSDSMPSKGLHGGWNGLHGMGGCHRTTAIVPLLLLHPYCH